MVVKKVYIYLLSFFSSFSLLHVINEWQVLGKWSAVFALSFFYLIYLLLCRSMHSGKVEVHDKNECLLERPALLTNLFVCTSCFLQFFNLIPNNNWFIAADFDNPAGVATVLTLTFPLVYIDRSLNYRITRVLFLFSLNVIVLLLIKCRIGILALMVSNIVYLSLSINHRLFKYRFLLYLLLVLFIALFAILLCCKTDSTSGRFLIYRVCLNLIIRKPMFGYGFHGFRQNYMIAQSDFLVKLSSPYFDSLAGSVNNPLSDVLLVCVNWGVAGLLVVLLCMYIIVRYHLVLNSEKKKAALTILTALAVLSLFSYPFRYPISIIMICFCSPFKLNGDSFFSFLNRHKYSSLLVVLIMLMSISLYGKWYYSQIVWKRVVDLSNVYRNNIEMLKMKVIPLINKGPTDNPRYQYTMGVVYYLIEDYSEAITICSHSLEKYPCYETELLLSESYSKMSQKSDCIRHAETAMKMCPSRFMPLLVMFDMYYETDDPQNMFLIGNEILEKKIKINTDEIRAIRFDVRRRMYEYTIN